MIKIKTISILTILLFFVKSVNLLAQNSVTIGRQTWMAENLSVDHFRNGDPIPQAQTTEEWTSANLNKQPAWCYYDNDLSNGKKYGKIYNWHTIVDKRGLAPEGWHIPSTTEWSDEWSNLFNFLGGTDFAGTKLKSKDNWNDGNSSSNSSGFSALPGGYRDNRGQFRGIGEFGRWWSKYEVTFNKARSWAFFSNSMMVGHVDEYHGAGAYVRCVK